MLAGGPALTVMLPPTWISLHKDYIKHAGYPCICYSLEWHHQIPNEAVVIIPVWNNAH